MKLWAMMRAHGRRGLAGLMCRRLLTTRAFTGLVDDNARLLRLNEPDMTAVVFMYLPTTHDPLHPDVRQINAISKAIHARILEEGRWHCYQFSLPDDTGRIEQDATLHPLRFMGNNGRITEKPHARRPRLRHRPRPRPGTAVSTALFTAAAALHPGADGYALAYGSGRPPHPQGLTITTLSRLGPCTPSTRSSSMSLVAEGPEIHV
ncbi:hypothetical protein ABZY16_05160 [Streptomyces sp. NPDC006553]|uniref:hypothetical protein n=1 Tax=Streptomyces sp. NPDC006553 TaxID=3157180 RepID=UPI0033A4F32E